METFCRVRIGATTEEKANAISLALVKNKLVAGTLIHSGNCHYWWKNEINEKVYWSIEAFSFLENKDKIIEEVKKIHSDQCPVIAFNNIDGSEDFLNWIKESVE